MARLPYLEKEDLSPENQDLLTRNMNLFKILAHSPEGMRSFLKAGSYIRFKSKLDARLRELAILQVGWTARAPYEWSHHVKIAHEFNVSDEDIQAIIDDNEGKISSLDPLAKFVCAAARELTKDLKISDATFAGLQKELSRQDLADLILSIAYYNAVVRVLASFEVDVEDSYMQYLEKFPLPKM